MISASIPNDIRRELYRRDGYACALCGDPRHLQIHHVIPRGSGGGNSPRNLIVLCMYCHAMAHGSNLNTSVWLSAEECAQYAGEVEQACVEYLDDLYAGTFPFSPGSFSPFDVVAYDDPDAHGDALLEIQLCYTRKEMPPHAR